MFASCPIRSLGLRCRVKLGAIGIRAQFEPCSLAFIWGLTNRSTDK